VRRQRRHKAAPKVNPPASASRSHWRRARSTRSLFPRRSNLFLTGRLQSAPNWLFPGSEDTQHGVEVAISEHGAGHDHCASRYGRYSVGNVPLWSSAAYQTADGLDSGRYLRLGLADMSRSAQSSPAACSWRQNRWGHGEFSDCNHLGQMTLVIRPASSALWGRRRYYGQIQSCSIEPSVSSRYNVSRASVKSTDSASCVNDPGRDHYCANRIPV
jgi:hypothetical protein